VTRPIQIRATLTVRSMRCLLALACSSILAAQEAVAVEPDPASLPLDALIERLTKASEKRMVEGDSPSIRAINAEFARRLETGVALSTAQWERVLFGERTLQWPRRWPVDVPFAVSARFPGWLGAGSVIFLDPQQPGLRRARVGSFPLPEDDCGMVGLSLIAELRHQELGTLSLGLHEITVQLELRRTSPAESWVGLDPWLTNYLERMPEAECGVPTRAGGAPRLPTLVSTGVLQLAVEVVPTADDAVTPVQTPELAAAVRRSLELLVYREGPSSLRVSPVPELEGIGLSLEIVTLQGDQVVERRHLNATREERDLLMFGGEVRLDSIPRNLANDAGLRSGWRLRVSGTNVQVLKPWTASRWAGTIEVTLAKLVERHVGNEPR
jgi:hypothetical protein